MTVETRLAVLEKQDDVDQRWRDRHENECSQQYRSMGEQITRLHSRIDKLLYLQLTTAVTAVLSMAVLVAQMLVRHGP